jgi:hypothetical protein
MKTCEVKMRLSNGAINLIDTYFNGSNFNEKFMNSTLKIVLKQNIHKLDSMLALFADKDGDINMHDIIEEYANIFDDNGFVFDIKNFVDNDIVRNIIPDKVLIIKKEDILNLLD